MIIQSTRVYVDEKLQPLQVEITDNIITNIMPYGCKKDVIDYGDAIVLPGLIDVHNHGYFGGQCNYCSKEWLKEWTSYLPSEGVTSTLFSFSCGNHERLFESLRTYNEFCNEGYVGTQLIGAYSEGPFVGQRPGAQNTAFKIVPDKEIVDKFIEASGNRMKYIMLAPEELNGNYDIIRYCREKGIKVSIGHSAATFEECQAAIQAGVTSFTHTYNGMTGLHHREPGVVGAAMYHEDCYCELICDGIHVNKYSANILARIKGKDRIMLITDSVKAKGYAAGEFDDGTGRIIIIGEDGSIKDKKGTISGSGNKLNKVLKYAIKEAKIDPVTAYNGIAKNQCDLLNIPNKGQIKVGFDADIAVFNDDYDCLATYILGKKVK